MVLASTRSATRSAGEEMGSRSGLPLTVARLHQHDGTLDRSLGTQQWRARDLASNAPAPPVSGLQDRPLQRGTPRETGADPLPQLLHRQSDVEVHEVAVANLVGAYAPQVLGPVVDGAPHLLDRLDAHGPVPAAPAQDHRDGAVLEATRDTLEEEVGRGPHEVDELGLGEGQRALRDATATTSKLVSGGPEVWFDCCLRLTPSSTDWGGETPGALRAWKNTACEGWSAPT